MSVPTDLDRAKADGIVSRWTYKGEAYFDRAVRDIAQALADERAQAYGRGRDDEADGLPLHSEPSRG